jgi:hypothetical protein
MDWEVAPSEHEYSEDDVDLTCMLDAEIESAFANTQSMLSISLAFV